MKWALLIVIGLIVLALLPPVLTGRGRSRFDTAVDTDTLRQAVTTAAPQVCSEQPLDWSATPGFTRGEYLRVGQDCADPSRPGAHVWIAQFESADARDTALVNAEAVYRRPIGTAITWSDGPFIVVVDGDQDPAVVAQVRGALARLGAQ
jgi:hypothetical protein